MKSKIALAVLALSAAGFSANADVLAGWYGQPGSPNTTESGISGNFAGGDGGRDLVSSSDGTYGPIVATGDSAVTGAGTSVSGIITTLRSGGNSTATLSITNNTGNDVVLEAVVWDMFVARSNDNGANAFNLAISSASDNAASTSILTTINTVGIEAVDWMTENVPYDMNDYSFDLTTLADNVLADGESMSLIFDEDASSGPPIFIDNTAILGYVVPEPISLALLGLGGLLVARRKRA